MWIVSFKKIQEIDSNVADLLLCMSQIELKVIPHSLLPQLDSEVLTVNAIGTLYRYAFMSR